MFAVFSPPVSKRAIYSGGLMSYLFGLQFGSSLLLNPKALFGLSLKADNFNISVDKYVCFVISARLSFQL